MHEDIGLNANVNNMMASVILFLNFSGPSLHRSDGARSSTTQIYSLVLRTWGEEPLNKVIPRVLEAGVVLLGGPVEDYQFVRDTLERRVEKT